MIDIKLVLESNASKYLTVGKQIINITNFVQTNG